MSDSKKIYGDRVAEEARLRIASCDIKSKIIQLNKAVAELKLELFELIWDRDEDHDEVLTSSMESINSSLKEININWMVETNDTISKE